ncbi:hypothetical protein Peur_070700 [Populus x canadensis]
MSIAAWCQMDIILLLSHMIEPSSCIPAEAMTSMLWRLNELALDSLWQTSEISLLPDGFIVQCS